MPATLKELEVSLDQLLLDPNNPRFISDSKVALIRNNQDPNNKTLQETLLSRFSTGATDEDVDEDTTNIQDLRDSMLRIGYVPIDKVVVRKLASGSNYLVIEGNRRVATLKSLVKDFKTGASSAASRSPDSIIKYQQHEGSFLKLPVLELVTDNLTPPEIEHAIGVVLGIRHHGSVLEWEPLPKAYNIYCEYRKVAGDDFKEIELSHAKKVANKLCISQADVSKALKTYTVYLQVKKDSDGAVRNEDYSLIESAVTNKYLVGYYLRFKPNTYSLEADSIERLIRICQFGRRDSLPPTPVVGKPKKIIPDPKAMRQLGQILQLKRQDAKTEVAQAFIDHVISRIEDENSECTVSLGLDEVRTYLASLNWRVAIRTLVEEQASKAELSVDKFTGVGNEKGYWEESKRITDNVSKIMGLN